MATGELLRPGVEIIQTFKKPAPSFVRPTLAPCVVGPAFEVINILNTDATINYKALWGAYSQVGQAITESSFPNPRGNIDELDILEDTIRPFLLANGQLSELVMAPGSAFLAAAHVATKAAFKTAALTNAGQDLNNKVLVVCFDNPAPADKQQDITIVFTGTGPDKTGNLTAQDVVDQVNAAVGQIVASVVNDVNGVATTVVQISSPSYGSTSSVTVRAGGSANTQLTLATAHDERVEGSGFRAQDPKNGLTQGTWIEFYQGCYFLNGVDTTFPSKAGLVDIVTGAFTSAKHGDVTFSGTTPTYPIVVGDYFFADGIRVKTGEVMKVETSRFKIGTINTDLSVVDSNGNYLSKVYAPASFGTIIDDSPFNPKLCFFVANGLNWKRVGPTAATVTGLNSASAALPAKAQAGAIDVSGLNGTKIHYVVTIDGVETDAFFTFTSAPETVDEIVNAIGSGIPGVIASNNSDTLLLSTQLVGRFQNLVIMPDGSANPQLGFSTSQSTGTIGVDASFAGIVGKSLVFQMDDNPHLFSVVFVTTSLDQACDEINAAVGAVVAEKDSSGLRLKMTSTLKGLASRIQVTDQSPDGSEGSAAGFFNLPTTKAIGTGRPFPNAYLDDASVLHVGSQMLRDPVTGFPYDSTTVVGSLYIQYKALRRDVTASAKVAGVLKISDATILTSVLDPLTEENPLGLGTFLCMLNAPNFEVKALGVDQVTPSAMEGTEEAWLRAAALLEAEEVYAIAPLTTNEVVSMMWATHATVMSSPEQGGERIAFINKLMPTRKNSKVAISGTKANTGTQPNILILDSSPAQGLLTAGINHALPMPASMGVYVEVTVAGQLRRYNVGSISGSALALRTTFSTSENTDAFFSTTPLTESVVDSPYSLKVLGAPLAIPGSNPQRYDYSTMADTIAEANSGIKNRRVYSVFPETIKTMVQGTEKALPGYYASAALAGMVAAQPPQQGFTNFPITGITGVQGTEKFTKRQLNIMAGGGTFILMQEVVGGAVFCRHQVSTDLSSIETRELSITKVVDFTAKFLRLGVRKYIGTNNVTTSLLDSLGATVHAILKFLEEAGVLNGSNLNNIAQDKDQPDTVLIDVTLDVPFPCNYIRLTLVV